MKKAIMILAVFCSLAVTGSAQKFALIDMEYILKSIPAYEMANEQLKQVSTRWQREIETKAKEAETLFNNYKSEQVYLSKEQQQSLYDTMECEDCTPSLAQAIKMKEFSRDGKLTVEEAAAFDFGATLRYNEKPVADQSSVKCLYTGITSNWQAYSSTTTPPTEPGRYVMTAVTVGGNYQAAPITRSFQITK